MGVEQLSHRFFVGDVEGDGPSAGTERRGRLPQRAGLAGGDRHQRSLPCHGPSTGEADASAGADHHDHPTGEAHPRLPPSPTAALRLAGDEGGVVAHVSLQRLRVTPGVQHEAIDPGRPVGLDPTGIHRPRRRHADLERSEVRWAADLGLGPAQASDLLRRGLRREHEAEPSLGAAGGPAVGRGRPSPTTIGGPPTCTGRGWASMAVKSVKRPWNETGAGSVHSALSTSRCSSVRAPPLRERAADGEHLRLEVAGADPEDHPASAQRVEAGDLLGQHDRVALGEDDDPVPSRTLVVAEATKASQTRGSRIGSVGSSGAGGAFGLGRMTCSPPHTES